MMCMRVGYDVYCLTMEKYAELHKIHGVKLAELPELWKEHGEINKEL